MTDMPLDHSDSQSLVDEITRLRGMVAQLERRIEDLDRLAHNDTLVPLLNRRGFVRQLKKLIARADRYGDKGAMLFVDVDDLKALNDSFGHHAGDAALCHIAQLLRGDVRESDCVARVGGDEFAVLLEHTGSQQAAEAARRLADRIAESRFVHDGAAIPLSAAIGIATIEPGDNAEAVLIRADQAMYQEKVAA